MKILAFEASAKAAGVAVTENGKILGEYYTDSGLTHSETLMPMCESLLKTLKLTLNDIDLLAVSAGPGSFTGLRIAVSAVKGIMLGSGKRCVPVSTLEALAQNVSMFEGIICAAMDARCNQTYNALFSCESGKITRLCNDRAISVDELVEELKKFENKPIICVGDGAHLCYNSAREMKNVSIAPQNLVYQHASSVALIANEDNAVDERELSVIYLRLAQAERERLENKKGE